MEDVSKGKEQLMAELAQLRERLREAEEKGRFLDALMQFIPEGITICGGPPDFPVRSTSRYGEELAGRPAEGVPSGAALEEGNVFPGDERSGRSPERMPLYRATRLGEVSRDEEWVLERPDGKKVPLLCNAGPIRDENGNIIGGVAAWRDITVRKRAAREIGKYRQHLEKLVEDRTAELLAAKGCLSLAVENAGMGIWDLDLETEEATWSENKFRLIGYAPRPEGRATREMWRSRIYPEDLGRVVREVESAKKERRVYSIEYRIVRADDNRVAWVTEFGRYSYDPAGKPIRLAGILFDSTERKMAEIALGESEARFRSLFELSLDGIFALDPGGRFLMANPAAERLSGFTRAELRALTFLDVCAPECGKAVLASFARGMATGLPDEIEATLICKDGRRVDLLVAGSPMVVSGRVEGIFCIARDITEAKRAERALRETEERFRAFMDNSPTTAWMKDEDGRYVYLSASGERSFGARGEDCYGKTDFDLFSAELAAQYREGDLRVLQGKRFIGINEESTRPDGSRRSWWKVKFPFQDSAGRRYVGGIGLDITERRRMEEDLRASEERYRALVHATSNAVWRFSADGKKRLSLVGAGVVEQTEPEEHGGDWLKFVHPEDRARTLETWQRAVEARGLFEIEHRLMVAADGTCRFFLSRGVPVLDGAGEVQEWIGASADITERKLAEEELRKYYEELEIRVRERTVELAAANRELREFPGRLIAAQEVERKRLACELHDSIGQTLAALKFGIETVLHRLALGDCREATELLERYVPTLQYSIEETRAIYMGLRPRMLEEMGLEPTLLWFCREMRKLHPGLHIELQTDLAEERIPMDLKITVFRIVQEALNNAAKHSKAEWVDISVTSRDYGLDLDITDDGIGMDKDYILRSPTARSLGLTSMRERAELTEGKLTIVSAPGEGTSIRVFWPGRGAREA